MGRSKKPDDEKLVIVNFRLHRSQLAALRDLAQRTGRTVTDVIRDVLSGSNVMDISDDQPKGKTAGR